jgi:SpoVK/Ycf46/Vps4 family AAA+-type ATPase
MNQALLTRLFKSIEGDNDTPLMKIAYSVIEDEKKKGHTKLADKLNIILKEKSSNSGTLKSFKVAKERDLKIPVDRRYKLPLATHVAHENLRHQMILPHDVEEKIKRIEKEYMASERLAHHGLKPRKKVLFYGSSGCGKSMAAE